MFWNGANLINAVWYAAEGNTEMAIASAVYALLGIGMASGRLMMCSDKLYKAGKAVYRASKLTQGCYGVIGGLTMAGAGIGNIYNSLKNGEKISFKDILLAADGTAIAVFSGKSTFSDMKQMLGISNKMDRMVKVGNADISHEPVPSEKKILEAAESGNNSNIYYHSCADGVADIIADTGFRTDIPDEVSAFHNNRYGRGVYLADSPTTALAERPGETILKVEADIGKNLDLTSRGIIGGDDYTMTHSIARGARKHGYDSITFMSAKNPGGINTVIFNPSKVQVQEVIR